MRIVAIRRGPYLNTELFLPSWLGWTSHRWFYSTVWGLQANFVWGSPRVICLHFLPVSGHLVVSLPYFSLGWKFAASPLWGKFFHRFFAVLPLTTSSVRLSVLPSLCWLAVVSLVFHPQMTLSAEIAELRAERHSVLLLLKDLLQQHLFILLVSVLMKSNFKLSLSLWKRFCYLLETPLLLFISHQVNNHSQSGQNACSKLSVCQFSPVSLHLEMLLYFDFTNALLLMRFNPHN